MAPVARRAPGATATRPGEPGRPIVLRRGAIGLLFASRNAVHCNHFYHRLIPNNAALLVLSLC